MSSRLPWVVLPVTGLLAAWPCLGACTYSISLSELSYTAMGGYGRFDVYSQQGCAWSASANVSWIVITSGSAGS